MITRMRPIRAQFVQPAQRRTRRRVHCKCKTGYGLPVQARRSTRRSRDIIFLFRPEAYFLCRPGYFYADAIYSERVIFLSRHMPVSATINSNLGNYFLADTGLFSSSACSGRASTFMSASFSLLLGYRYNLLGQAIGFSARPC